MQANVGAEAIPLNSQLTVSSADFGNEGSAGSATSYKLVTASGNPLIDGVLSGVAWKTTNLTFAYPTAGTDYGQNYGRGENATFSPFTTDQRLAADFARTLISDYTLLKFTAAPAATANLRYGDHQNTGIYGNYPDGFAGMGDIWYGTGNRNQGTAVIGAFDFATILHEQGHTLGLKHGQDTGINGGVATTADGQTISNFAPLPTVNDNWNYSLMSYRSYQGASSNPIQGSLVSDNPTSYMISDIAALQYMYGANFSGASSTNTVYSWDAAGNKFVNGALFLPAAVNGKVFETIWDGGGTDTYDTSNFSTNQSIDLRPGNFSTFDSSKLADLDRSNPGIKIALGNVGNALQFQGDARSLIENASTGSGNDTIIGNDANNVLRGNAGNDRLSGGAGNDTLDGGTGTDAAFYAVARAGNTVTRKADGTITVSGGASVGTDTLISIERVEFSDGALIYDVAFTADPALVYRIYQAAFARTPDETGFRFWEGAHSNNGVSFLDMAAQFRTSAEFIQKYGANISNNTYTTALYTNVLQRTPDAAGLSFWQGVLNSGGETRDQLLLDFAGSSENVTLTAANITNGYWVL